MSQETIKGVSAVDVVKWVSSFLVPALVYYLLPIDGVTLTHSMAMFLVVTIWAVSVWAMDLINDIAVGMLLPTLYIVLCGVPGKVIAGPWSSQVPNTIIGGFILCKILQDTGLGRRIGLGSMNMMGGSFIGALIGLMCAVFVINPFIPSAAGKAIIFCAIVVSLCESLDFKKQSREATAFMLVAFVSVASSKLCFLTGGVDLVLGMDLVDKVLATETSWLEYAMWNFLPATLYALMSVAIVIIMLPSRINKDEFKAVLQMRYNELGSMSKLEKRAALLMMFTLVMLSTDKWHGMATGMTLIFVAFIAFIPKVGLMTSDSLRKVNFSPLFFIMGCMAIGSAGNFLKATDWLAANSLHYFESLSVTWAGIASYVFGVTGNFLLTPLAATASLSSPLIELGLQMGVEPLVLYFSFQYGLDNYIFPYEYAILLLFYSFGYIHFASMVKMLAVRMVATALFLFFIAIPFWNWII